MDFPIPIPFLQHLGIELLRLQPGEAELRLALRPEQLNSFGVAHGGLVMTLLDAALAHAARSSNLQLPDGGPGVVTIEMKTSFLRPGDGTLRAVGTLLHRTATLAFCEGRVYAGSTDALAAHATGTFKYVRGVAGNGREVKALQRRLDGPGSD